MEDLKLASTFHNALLLSYARSARYYVDLPRYHSDHVGYIPVPTLAIFEIDLVHLAV